MILLVSSCNADTKNDNSNGSSDVKLTTSMDTVSYILGVNLGTQLKQDSLSPNHNAVAMGVKDAMDDKVKIDEAKRNEVLQAFVADMQEKFKKKQEEEMEKMKASGAKNLEDGKKFLAENKNKEGVKVTASGLQYKVINPGSSKKPKSTDEVTVHYKGTLLDGKVFDSSYDRGEPAQFTLNGVIPGWTEGLQLIGEGGKVILYIPSELAYGEQSMGNIIPPNSTLTFEVELIKIGK